jgi:hypothetical protein
MTPRQSTADDFERIRWEIRNPDSMNAWSERVEEDTLGKLAARVDKQLARMEAALRAAGVNPETLT